MQCIGKGKDNIEESLDIGGNLNERLVLINLFERISLNFN